VLKAVGFSVPAEPRAWLKKPSFSPTSAEAWVMFSRKPSRTVTGAAALLAAPAGSAELDDEDEDEDDEEQPAASSRAAPIIAAAVTRRISHS
jgi:hypothetical protein